MKTAISVEDDLLKKADQAARQMGLSRSRLFSLALEDYLRHRRNEEMTERLNRVYSDPRLQQKDRQMAAKIKAKFRSTIRDPW